MEVERGPSPIAAQPGDQEAPQPHFTRRRVTSLSSSTLAPGPILTAPSWEPTLFQAIQSIVSIRATHVRSFDTDNSGSYTATGFLVDADLGLILTNRHVVSPGPITAQAMFRNYREVSCRALYRDPIHDFGFLKFDPKFINNPVVVNNPSSENQVELTNNNNNGALVPLTLRPDKVKVGMEIRVVGNDAGEKLSILSGTLARLDRPAPDYGVGEYTDFNTFYYQAASGTSGGSSGSPVLDIYGHAVALNAGGSSQAASSFYLPLDRVTRALSWIQGQLSASPLEKFVPPPRGTFQVEWEYVPYDELRRLGLGADLEIETRRRHGGSTGNGMEHTGLLVVTQCIPEGPADGILKEGDILLKIQDKWVSMFIQVAEILDENVDKVLELTVCRMTSTKNSENSAESSGKLVTVEIRVQDLHKITPDRYVEVGGGIVHTLSYQLAKSYHVPVRGVFVAASGHMLGSGCCWRRSIITHLAHQPVQTLDEFIKVVGQLKDGERVPVKFFTLGKKYRERVMIMTIDRHWHSFRVAVRNDLTGLWDVTEGSSLTPEIYTYQPATAMFPTTAMKPADRLWPCFVSVDFRIPFLYDGIAMIVDKVKGLCICDRDTVPIGLGDITLTFANSIVIPGRLIWLHPVYNFCVLQYDPSLLKDTAVEQIELSDQELEQGDPVILVAMGNDHTLVMKRTLVSSVGPLGTKECNPPRWRATNVEGIKIEDPIACQGGVLTDEKGLVKALWLNYTTQNERYKDINFQSGLSVNLLKPILEPFRLNRVPELRAFLDIEFWTMRISAARSLGIKEEWLREMEKLQPRPQRNQLLYVLNVVDAAGPAANILRVGDVILTMTGGKEQRKTVVTRMRELDCFNQDHIVQMEVLRSGHVIQVEVPTTPCEGFETYRILHWSGALLQAPYRAVLEQNPGPKPPPSQIYLSCTLFGSPANTFHLRPGLWVTEVNGVAVHTLDDFLAMTSSLEKPGEDGTYIRLTCRTRQAQVTVISVKTDPWYWKSWQLRKDSDSVWGWIREL